MLRSAHLYICIALFLVFAFARWRKSKVNPGNVCAANERLTLSQARRNLDTAFGDHHGCLPVKTVFSGQLPLGIDLAKSLAVANASQRLMSFLQPYIDRQGPTFELRILSNAGIVTIDPENAKAILTKSKYRDGLDWGYGERRDALLPLFGDGIFTQDGPKWKRSREMLRKHFARIQYQNLDGFADHVEQLVVRLAAAKGDSIDLQPLFFNFTLDTSTSLLFGESAGSLREGDDDEFGSNLNDASWYSAIRVQLAWLYWLCCPPQYFRACNRVRAYADHWVKKALDEPADKCEAKAQHELVKTLYEELADRKAVREQLVNVLLAGRDTTACLLSWTLRLLVRHPTVLAKLAKEIEAVQGDSVVVKKTNFTKMPYLKAVIDETLRLYPPVPINFREADHTTVLPRGGGLDGQSPLMVPKQMGIGYSPYYMHRRKDLYGDDAFDFRPERWQDGTLHEKIGWAYLPFNGGPRVCLGQDFALLEASYAIVRIVQSFPQLGLPADEPDEPLGTERKNITLTMAPADGCRVRLGPRVL